MKMNMHTTLHFPDGDMMRADGLCGFIQRVRVHDTLRGQLARDSEALISGILVTRCTSPVKDASLVFTYNERRYVHASIEGLMARYHNLATVVGLQNRLRLLVDPQANLESELFPPLFSPFAMREGIDFEFKVLPPGGSDAVVEVEIQGRIRNGSELPFMAPMRPWR